MSGSYATCLQAVAMLKEDYPEAEIRVVDTLAAANGMAVLIERAVALRDQGASMDAIVDMVTGEIGPRVRSWVTVDDLHHLQRGGRISKVAAVAGTMLNVKPIIDVDAKGSLKVVTKVRGRKRALEYLVKQTVEELDTSVSHKIYINYSGDIADAEKVKEMIASQSDIAEFEINPLGPTIATHTGAGTIAVFSISKDER
jgi:DegV family protein with EDD domain